MSDGPTNTLLGALFLLFALALALPACAPGGGAGPATLGEEAIYEPLGYGLMCEERPEEFACRR